jgi:NADPH-dependent curcumin reductase CurA
MANRRILFARVPSGLPVPDDFSSDEVPVPSPGPGQFLSRTCWLSLDPYYRNVMKGSPMYA